MAQGVRSPKGVAASQGEMKQGGSYDSTVYRRGMAKGPSGLPSSGQSRTLGQLSLEEALKDGGGAFGYGGATKMRTPQAGRAYARGTRKRGR